MVFGMCGCITASDWYSHRILRPTQTPILFMAFQQIDRFPIECFDAVLRPRMTPAEWTRVCALRNHPRFPLALATYDALMPDYFADNLILNKIVTEAWRFEMLVYTLYLGERDEPPVLTVSGLQKICSEQNCASPGRVMAILGIMNLGGYLSRQKSVHDKRIKILAPTKGFLKIVEGWNQIIFQIIDAVHPEDQLARGHAAIPCFGRDMRQRGAQTLLAGWKLLDPFPEVFQFVSKDGGWMLLLHCASRALAGWDGDTLAPVSVDLRAFGARFGVSRSHLRRILESAHEAGLLIAPPSNGSDIRLSNELVASFMTCMASELGNYRLWALEGARARPASA